MDDAELSVYTGVPMKAIRAYKELFFDVEDKINQKSYIEHYVIGSDIQNLQEDNYETIWKLFGYHLGPKVLQAIVSRTVNPRYCQSADSVNASLKEDIMGSFQIACAVASKHPAGGTAATKHLTGLFAKFMEVDKMEDLSSSSNQLIEHIKALIGSLQFTVGGTYPSDNPMQLYHGSSCEPTLEDLIEISAKGKSEAMDEASGIKYPPVVSKKKKK